MGHFGAQSQLFNFSLSLLIMFFLTLYWMAGVKKWVKMTCEFLRKILSMPKMGHFCAQINIFDIFSKSFH